MINETISILYIDDDADDRELLVEAFHNVAPNITVTTAQNGLEGWNLLQSAKKGGASLPNLVVLDLNMPYLDGRETFERLKEDPELKDLPVVIFTSGERPADRDLFEGSGVEYLNKPIDQFKLNQIVSHMVAVCK